MLNFELAKSGVGLVHIADNDGNVLEPAVIALGVDRNRTTAWRKELHQFDMFVSQRQAYHPQAQTKNPIEVLIGVARNFALDFLMKGEYARIEVDRALQVRDRNADRVNGSYERSGAARGRRAGHVGRERGRQKHRSYCARERKLPEPPGRIPLKVHEYSGGNLVIMTPARRLRRVS